MSSLLWYDLETFGRNPFTDRVAQFAAVRTDDQFQPLGEPVVLYCRISPDYIPDPGACLITGITPDETLEKGLSEYEFIKAIHKEFSQPGTCVAGYNNIRFDDEFIRNLYYRNFMDPYTREWQNGNSRWDLVDVVRVTHDLRPEGIVWPVNNEGRVSFKLEDLTKANNLSHDNAHDALNDVWATIALAKLIDLRAPKLFRWFFRHRKKDALKPLIDFHKKIPLVHTSSMFTRKEGCTSVILPLVTDPRNRNCIISFDLREDPEPLLSLPLKDIRRLVFSSVDELEPGEKRIPLKGIHINKSPILAPMSVLDKESASRLNLDLDVIEKRVQAFSGRTGILQKIRALYEQSPEYASVDDPDMQIYSGGFFRDDDKEVFTRIHNLSVDELINFTPDFHDPRLPEMFRRFKGRNFSKILGKEDRTKWFSYCASRILMPPHKNFLDLGTFNKKIETLSLSSDLSPGKRVVLKKLKEYSELLKRTVLDYKE